MPTLNFLPVWFALSLLRFRLPSRLPMMFILWMVPMRVVIIPSTTGCLFTSFPFLRAIIFFFNDTATTEIYPLSLHDALPIYFRRVGRGDSRWNMIQRDRLRLLHRRSEEHTSELQSLTNLVCRLLLVKKDADPKFFACLVRFESSSVPTTLTTAYDVYPLDGPHEGGDYTVNDWLSIYVLPLSPRYYFFF